MMLDFRDTGPGYCAGTSKALAVCAPSIQPEFVPSVANAETLSAELPLPSDKTCRVLYPASFKARTTLQRGLEERGCEVVRLNTYSTEKVQQVSQQQLEDALACSVVAIASPSALKAWFKIAGQEQAMARVLACIGSTSGNAALALGYSEERVIWSENPGLEGLVNSIEQALEMQDKSEKIGEFATPKA
jgi:uroporphyrinogen-III synthase